MAWAWSTTLPPTPKLVLTALADIADDQGVCWPSVKAMARKCSLSARSVQRILQSLQLQHLLSIEPRLRKDGSRTSNRYRLAIDALPPGQIVRGCGHRCQGVVTLVTGGGDTDVTPGTTNEPSIKSSQQRCADKQQSQPPRPERIRSLVFPHGLNDREREALGECVSTLVPETAQQVLNELGKRMRLAQIKYPARYCAALVNRWKRRERRVQPGGSAAEKHVHSQPREIPQRQSFGTSASHFETVISRLPNEMRASLERIRSRLGARQEDEPAKQHQQRNADDAASSER